MATEDADEEEDVPSCLETTELSSQFQNLEDYEIERQRLEALRLKIAHRLRKEMRGLGGEENELAEKEALKLEGCDSEVWLRCEACHAATRGRTRCKRRWCPTCQPMLAAKRAAKYERAAALIKWPLHVTLTKKNTKDLRKESLRELLEAFRDFRRSTLWTRSVTGGMVSCELTNKGRGWHPHLHILCDSRWLAEDTPPPMPYHSRGRKAALLKAAAEELQKKWSPYVGQKSSSIKARRCSAQEAVREVLKYAVKGSELAECEGSVFEVIRAMKGNRLYTTFGSLYKLRSELKEPPKRPCKCGRCGAEGTIKPEEIVVREAMNGRR